MSEGDLQDLCVSEIRAHLDTHGFTEVRVGKEVPVIKDCTFVHENDGFSLYLGHAKTDVCAYVEAEQLTAHLEETSFFKLYQNGDKTVNVPLAILETKRGNADGKLNTDSIRSRTIVAREVNEIFPHCGYFFVADRMGASSPGKVHRAGKHFDAFYTCDGLADREWLSETVLKHAIGPYLEELAADGIISTA